MINYRNIFNSSYTYIGLLIIALITILILITNKNIIITIYTLAKSSLISSIITLITGLALNLIMNNFIITKYKILIQVISNNVINSIYLYSGIIIIISIITIISIKYFAKTSDIAVN